MKDGTFTGTYAINSTHPIMEFPAVGRYDTTTMGAVGWTVSWQNKSVNWHATTSWSGWFKFDKSGEILIFTSWTRTLDGGGVSSGGDVFKYKRPSAETIEFAKLRGHHSHPIVKA